MKSVREDEITDCRLEADPEPPRECDQESPRLRAERATLAARKSSGRPTETRMTRSVVSIGLSEPSSRPPPAQLEPPSAGGSGSQRAKPSPQIFQYLGQQGACTRSVRKFETELCT